MNCNETLTILRWFRPSENYNFWKNFKKYYFCQIDIMIHFFIQNLSKNLNIAFSLIKNRLSICHIRFSEIWYLKNLWKIRENFWVTLSWFSPFNLSYSSLFLRSHSLFPSIIVCGLCFAVNMHDMNVKIVQNKTKLVNERDCCCTNHLSTTD